MQNIVINMCEKFRNDRLRNDRFLGMENLITTRTGTTTRKTTLVAFETRFRV